MRIVHLTSAHSPTDNRIYYKEVLSLAACGHELFLIAPSSTWERTTSGGATTITIKRAKTRLGRFLVTTSLVFYKAWRLNADLYHFHDPDLTPYGLLLKLFGKKVVIDIHENYAGDVFAKGWIPHALRPLVSRLMQSMLDAGVKTLDGAVTADDVLRDRYAGLRRDGGVVSAHNYPIISPELLGADISRKRYENRRILFLGGASAHRCIQEFTDALDLLGDEAFAARIGGNHNDQDLLGACKLKRSWPKVDYVGSISFAGVTQSMLDSSISINLFSDSPNHHDIRSNRLFESMAAGLPVVVSNFPKWRAFIDEYQCGIAVDPHDPQEISQAINRLLTDPELCVRYASNGRRAALENYRWDTQAAKIKQLYMQIFSFDGRRRHRA